MTSCICQTGWCSDVRERHLFKNSLVNFTKDPKEVGIWLNHLEVVDAEDIVRIKALQRPRIFIGHFHQVDIQVDSDFLTKNITFKRIDFEAITAFQDFDTGNTSKLFPPRPSVTQNKIRNSNLMDEVTMLFEDYKILNSVNINGIRKRKNNIESAEEDTYKTPGKIPGLRRRRSDIYHHSFVGMADHLIDLLRAINSHGQNCTGQILFRDRAVRTKRFTLILDIQCSLHKNCTDANFIDGHMKWQSVSNIEISPGRSVFTTDVLLWPYAG